MFTEWLQNISITLEELASNKLRTFLSLLGITIGVFCIIAVFTLVDSLQNNIQENMKSLGSNILYVGKFAWIPEGKGEYPWWKYKARPACNLEELEAIEREVPSASYAALIYNDVTKTVKAMGNEVSDVSIFATTYYFSKVQAINIISGRYFTMAEMDKDNSYAIVLGYDVATHLFGKAHKALQKVVDVGGRKYRVVGVLERQGQSMTGFDFDGGVIVPFRTFNAGKRIDANTNNGFADPLLLIKNRPRASFEDMRYEVQSVLRAKRRIKPRDPDSFSFNQLEAIQRSIDDIFSSFKIIGLIIGAFSLLVGGFGIANIMFVSVKERTRLIGIKKAIGAKSSKILWEFILESIFLCMLGGSLGIIFVMLLSFLLSAVFDFPVVFSLQNFIIGISISVVLGLLFGFIPAYKASKLDPVVAIRS